ncbi:hypothetical protein AAG906_016975 [Vitis piasezkii]
MRLWRKCWQIPGIYGQPKRDRGQPGSSQGSHRNTTPQEQEGIAASHRQACRARAKIVHVSAISNVQSALFYSASPKEQKPIYYAKKALADEKPVFKDGANGLSS